MTESAYTAKLLKALRQRLPQAEVLKLSDRFTTGIPDFTVTLNGMTTWFEAKAPREPKIRFVKQVIQKEDEDNKVLWPKFFELVPISHVPAVQWETLRRLQRGYVIIYTDSGHGIVRVSEERSLTEPQKIKLQSMSKLLKIVIAVCHWR